MKAVPRCASGTTYTPASGDKRKFIVYFKDSTMSAYEPMPIMSLNYVPMSMASIEAEQVGAFGATHLIRAIDGSGTPATTPALTPAQLTEFNALINGSSSKYVTSQTAAGATIPTFTTAAPPASPVAGSFWFDTTAGALKYYDGSTTQTLGTSGGGAPPTGAAGGDLTGTYPNPTIANSAVTNAKVSATAAIDRSKLASGNANRLVVNDGSGVMTDAAAITASRALTSDANGIPVASSVTSTELGYVSGVTSAVQTQLNAKLGTATSFSGDVSGAYNSTSVDKIKGTALSITSLTSGDFLKYNGTNWVNSTISTSNVSGLGTAATKNVPSSGDAAATEVVLGNDSRLSDSRAPSGSAGGDLTGTYPNPTLTTTGVGAGTYTSVTVDTKGRVTGGTSPTTLTGYGITDAVKNAGSTPSIQTGLDASIPAAGTTGRIYIASDTKKIYRDNGTSWDSLGSAGSVTSVTASAPLSSSGGTTPDISISQANGSTDGYLSSTDWTTFNNKLGAISNTASLTDGKIWIGDNANKAQAITLSGDATVTNAGVVAVNKIKGTAVSATTPTTAGQVLRFDGTSWVPNFVAMTDIRSTVTGSTAFASSGCAANETLSWNSVGDILTCQSIGSLPASAISSGTIATARLGSGTADATTYLRGDNTWVTAPADATKLPLAGGTMTGALLLSAGSASAPSLSFSGDTNTGIYSGTADTIRMATGGSERIVVDTNGKVGIGVTAPTQPLHVHAQFWALARFTNDATGSTDSDGVAIGYDASSEAAAFWNRENSPLIFATNNSEKVRISADGKVGIGTTPSTQFEMTGVATIPEIIAPSASNLALRSPAGKKVFIDGDDTTVGYVYMWDKVAIGLSSAITPGAELEVNGQIKLNGGSPGAGKVLVSDANGVGSWNSSPYPTTATLMWDEATVTVGAAGSVWHNTAQRYGFGLEQSPAADGDTQTKTFFLKAGTYTMSVLGITTTNRGKVDWYIDDVLVVSGQDWYSAAGTYNVVMTATVTVTGDGTHVLKSVINGKNASSTDYALSTTKVWFK